MRRILAILFLLPIISFAGVERGHGQTSLSSLREVTALSNEQAAHRLPVKLTATVTYASPGDKNIFVTDDGYACYVQFGMIAGLLPGDRIELTGVTDPSFRPLIIANQVRFLSHGSLPQPKPAKFEDLIQAKLDSQYIFISGRVLSATLDTATTPNSMRIRVQVPDGVVGGVIGAAGNMQPQELIEAQVRLTAVAGGEYDSKMQMSGIWLYLNSWKDVEILQPPATQPWMLPAVPLDQVISSYRYSNSSTRVHVAGTLTYYEPGSLAVIEQNGKTMLLKTSAALPLRIGSGVEATGFPSIADNVVHLINAELRSFSGPTPLKPPVIRWENASTGEFAYNLVAMEGDVVEVVQDSRVDLLIIRSEDHLFSATLRHRSSEAVLPTNSAGVPTTGTRVRVTGICFMDTASHTSDRYWFDLRMRSLDDITVIEPPSWWTVKHLAYVTTMLSAAILLAVIWAGLLDRRLRTQTVLLAKQSQEDAIRDRRLARLEQHRSQILELISSSEPLPEVLREIAALVSARLMGAPCWFELHSSIGGTHETQRPIDQETVKQELFAPDGTSLGMLLATPPLRIATDAETIAAITSGARLAELAIDTRRLYSDLRHRSEYDLLTDIPNRFSMEKRLDHLMLKATQEESIFGLIYVDLDRFKEVNDHYGHRTGDLYLQAVTRRMKFQLRNEDVLARIGGDEFIALVPILRSRSDAEEITMRLERCFDEPFELDGYRLHGAASIGLAVFPEDGTNKEELQRSADANMYAHKQSKRQQERLAASMQRMGDDDLPE